MRVSESEEGWFHCGRCGHLFRGPAEPGRRGVCPSCGRDPVPDAPKPADEEAAGGRERVRHKRRRNSFEERGESKPRRHGSRKKARAVMIFTIVWVLMLAAITMTTKIFWPDSPIPSAGDPAAHYTPLVSEDQQLLHERWQACAVGFQEFLANSAPESRTTYVLGRTAMLGRLMRHQQSHPVIRSDETPEPLHRQVLHTPAGPAIETLWKLDGERTLEAVFFEDEDGEWRLDWENLVRSSAEPWALFLAGTGAPEGEFRLLARERAGNLDYHELGLTLYAPRADMPGETAAQSPGFSIPRESEMGRRILAAFEARKNDLGAFGSRLVANDPGGMIRLRVRVSRHEGENGERTFRIEELLACHWLHCDGEGKP